MDKLEQKPGTVRQVLYSNCLIISGPIDPQTGVPRTKMLTLAGIQTPEYSLQDKDQPKQEPYGFLAREYLRKLLINQKIEFVVEHKLKDSNDKVIGHLLFNNKDVAVDLLRQGLTKIRPGSKPVNQTLYEQAEKEAQTKKIGVWSNKTDLLEFQKVDLKEIQPSEFLNCLVEDVQGLFVFYVYVRELKALLKCTFGDIFMPNVTQILTNQAKWFLQDLILQQEVRINILGYEEKFSALRVDIFQENVDIKKELILKGYFKLAQNAYTLIGNGQRYNELKDAQSSAELKNLGIWKDVAPKKQPSASSSVTVGTKTFVGTLIEVHSGDSVTILDDKTRESIRVFIASVRAPNYTLKDQKPWGFEAKEFVRKHSIGRQVRVEIEFEKTIQPKQHDELIDDEEKKRGDMHMRFANVIILEEKETNLGFLVVQAGLAQVQPPRGEDGCSRYLDQLKEAQAYGESKHLGLHSNVKQALPKFNDLTTPAKAKQAFTFLKDEKRVTGVVEVVLNGSRFRMRFNEQNCFGIFLLSGVKCLPNDQNFPECQKYSNIALQFAKQQVLQRDVEIELESVDKKGVFHGHLLVGKTRENFGLKLLEMGLAIQFNPVQTTHKYSYLFEDAEKRAKARVDGLWGLSNLNLQHLIDEDQTASQLKSLGSEIKQLIATEIIDANEFYLQDPTSKILEKITSSLSSFTPNEQNKFLPPLKKGTLCIAKFTADGLWYRAKVTREIVQKNKDSKYEVFFQDYGNYDIVQLSSIRKTPENVANLPYQALRCQLAYVKPPSMKHPIGQKVAEFVKDQIFEKELVVQLEHTDDVSYFVVIYLTKDKSVDKTMNSLLLQKGFGKLDKNQPNLPQNMKKWVEFEEASQTEHKGVWNYDDEDEPEY